MRVADIVDQPVIGENGDEVGEVADIALMNDKVVAILEVGGFLGLGEHEVAMPLENMTMREDAFYLPTMTQEELEALPEYDFRQVTALPKRRTIEYSMTRR